MLREPGRGPVLAAAALAACEFLMLAGCQLVPPAPQVAPPPPRAIYSATTYDALPGWADDSVAAAWPAFLESCKALIARPARAAIWRGVCTRAGTIDGNDVAAVRGFFERNFTPWRIASSEGSDRGLVTGYFEPLLAGSRIRSAVYATPLYAPPDDLLVVDLSSLYPELKGKRVRGRLDGRRVVPYWTRADIEAGQSNLGSKVLVYVADPLDAFLLQVQGSGRVKLDDGAVMRLGYADENGQPYRSIAQVLVGRGELTVDQASMQTIRAWGLQHPHELPALLDANPSYVFFRVLPPPVPGSLEARIDGPIGALGVPLVAERTIAVDPRQMPLGAPVWLATTLPLSGEPMRRLVLAQDTGGAIRGPLRADLFWGFGDAAGALAGRMRQQGQMWLLWPNGAAAPAAD